jgi:TRAP-type C4-dicarboxylate transport system permease small subunit
MAGADRSGAAGEDDETAAMFAEWQQAEAHVDLSDLRPVDSIVFAVFWLLFVTVFLQFFTRYVLNDSFAWTEEIARYLLIGVTFIGSVMAVRKGSHIAVEAGLKAMPRRLRHIVLMAVDVLALAFSLFLAWTSVQLARNTRQAMVSIDIPKAYVYWLVAVTFVGMSVYAAGRVVQRWRGRLGDEPQHLTLD